MENFKKKVDETTKWFTETGSLMTDAYNKQLQMGFDFYNTLMKTAGISENSPSKFLEKNIELFKSNISKYSNLSKDMLKNSFDLSFINNSKKDATAGFDVFKNIAGVISDTLNKQSVLLTELNQKYFDSISKEFKVTNIKEFSQKLEEILKENLKKSKETGEKILASYTEKADFSKEANKKLLSEMNSIIDTTTKTILDFWTKIPKMMKFEKDEVEIVSTTEESKTSSKKTSSKK